MNPSTTPLVGGVLVTYRRPELLGITLAALANQTHRLNHLFVVDNDSRESARTAVVGMPELTYVPSGANLGPAGGLRLGVEAAASSCPWVMFLDDDDPLPGPDVVASMVAFLATTLADDAACAGVGAAGALFDRRRGVSRRPDMSSPQRALSVDWIGGGQFPLYRTEALLGAGVPDPGWFWGFDDLDLGLRLRHQGWNLYRDRDFKVETSFGHAKAAAPSAQSAWRSYYTTRNLASIVRRESSLAHGFAVGLRTIGGAIAKSPPGFRLRALRSSTSGLIDMLTGGRGWSPRANGPESR